jgi:hypothetical protein
MLPTEVSENLINWRDNRIMKNSALLKMIILPKLINGFVSIPVKISTGSFLLFC